MIIDKIKNFKIQIPVPIVGIGCGVLGMSLTKVSIHLGQYASTLLKALEYRGYDSTGAAFLNKEKELTLLKDVGAPSTLVKTLKIENQEGKIFCGQVRWATFGTVTQKNAQPHDVKCKRHIFGAHNGNITNTRELKDFLRSEGHNVVSDNDGEMLVHTIEHYFDNELDKYPCKEQKNIEVRRQSMRRGIIQASKKMVGSYAAIIVDPITEYSYAIKAGSSLYFGIGEIENNSFTLASSDLTAVLKFTKMLVNLREGECVEYNNSKFKVFAFKRFRVKVPNQSDIFFNPGDPIKKEVVRSKLRAEDTELLPQFDFFMDQEINAEIESSGKLVKLFSGGSNTGRRMYNLLKNEDLLSPFTKLCEEIEDTSDFPSQQQIFDNFSKTALTEDFYNKVNEKYSLIADELVKENFQKKYFFSSEKNTFIDLLGNEFNKKRLLISKALDTLIEIRDVKEFDDSINHFLKILNQKSKHKNNIYTIACGTSYHATLIASLFFNEIAKLNIIPVLPGNFRGQFSQSLNDNDVIIGVSQSGETKDLIDIFNDVEKTGLDIKKIVLVNNLNSTLGQEKSDVSIPIFCGPEIAVPATKSFINQITLFYYLAIKVAESRIDYFKENNPKLYQQMKNETEWRKSTLEKIPLLIKETIETTDEQIEYVASKIYQEPSMHILATKIMGIAKEGALKIRETVLNHTEGGEASEFKHGPNTILGKNTVFGIKNIKAMIKHHNNHVDKAYIEAEKMNIPFSERRAISKAISNYVFKKTIPFDLSKKARKIFDNTINNYDFFEKGYRNYPLIYITGPDKRDVNLTISQINTHKIRGGDTFVIAEENDNLLENTRINPHDEGYYGWGYITLPKTGDSLLTTFSATVVLQLLALKMSIKKMNKLDRLGIVAHGVHPDVPKNVSKSITVD